MRPIYLRKGDVLLLEDIRALGTRRDGQNRHLKALERAGITVNVLTS
ncbi:MAG: hypothetical protein AAFY56_18165 [Pseudomonadota bacterium]